MEKYGIFLYCEMHGNKIFDLLTDFLTMLTDFDYSALSTGICLYPTSARIL